MLRIVVGAREVPAYSTNENTFILKASNLVRRDSLNLACQVVEKTKGKKKTHTHTHKEDRRVKVGATVQITRSLCSLVPEKSFWSVTDGIMSLVLSDGLVVKVIIVTSVRN